MLKVKAKLKKGRDLKKVKKRLAQLEKQFGGKKQVVVGLPKEALPYPDGTSVVMVGFWNEFGTKNSPERPFLRNAFETHKKGWVKLSKALHKKVVEEKITHDAALGLLGQQMQADVQASITDGVYEPNAGDYGEFKKAKGKTKPLIFTGHMRGSIRYAVREL